MSILEGRRVKLRAMEPGDVERLYNWENDTAIWSVSNTLAPFSRFQLEQYVLGGTQDIFTTKQLRLMVDLVSSPGGITTIGSIDLFDYDPFHRRAGTGILITEPFRSRGHAFEAMNLLIRYAFGLLDLHQLYCNIAPGNALSVRLFRKLGFRRCAIKKEWVREGQDWQDEWMFQLIRHDG